MMTGAARAPRAVFLARSRSGSIWHCCPAGCRNDGCPCTICRTCITSLLERGQAKGGPRRAAVGRGTLGEQRRSRNNTRFCVLLSPHGMGPAREARRRMAGFQALILALARRNLPSSAPGASKPQQRPTPRAETGWAAGGFWPGSPRGTDGIPPRLCSSWATSTCAPGSGPRRRRDT